MCQCLDLESQRFSTQMHFDFDFENEAAEFSVFSFSFSFSFLFSLALIMQSFPSQKSSTKPRKATVWGIDFVSGGIAAATAKTVSAPPERIKLLYQTRGDNYNQLNARKVFDTLIREQGWKSLWRGNIPNILRYFPMQAFMLTFKEEYRKQIFNFSFAKQAPLSANILSGGLAGCSALTLIYPLDVARTRMAADISKSGSEREFKSMFDCIIKLSRNHGVLNGLFSGYIAGFLCYFGYRGLQIGGYDYIKTKYHLDVKKYKKNKQKENMNKNNSLMILSFKDFLFCYGISFFFTCFGQTCMYPLDTIRRRCIILNEIQMKNSFFNIYNQSGISGFYRGLFVNYARGFGSSLVLVLFDVVQPVIKQSLLENH